MGGVVDGLCYSITISCKWRKLGRCQNRISKLQKYHFINIIYSSGFLQNRNEVELTYKQLDSFNLKITIGPNPATSHILISCNQDGIIIQTIKIMDAFGITIKDIIEPAAGINYKKQIQFASLPNGIYLVLVKYTIAEKMVGFKLVKIIKI